MQGLEQVGCQVDRSFLSQKGICDIPPYCPFYLPSFKTPKELAVSVNTHPQGPSRLQGFTCSRKRSTLRAWKLTECQESACLPQQYSPTGYSFCFLYCVPCRAPLDSMALKVGTTSGHLSVFLMWMTSLVTNDSPQLFCSLWAYCGVIFTSVRRKAGEELHPPIQLCVGSSV